jgi:hypothetical protein
MSQELILYWNWVNPRLSRGLSAEALDFKWKECQFMYNWQRALIDIKESVRLASKSESEVLKFDAKDWLKWYTLINNYFRRTLGVRGITLNWVYREQAEQKPRVKYPLIAAEIKATLILEGNHFEEDTASVYAVVAMSTFDTTAYSYIRKFEESRNGREVMLALKLKFGGKAYTVSRPKAANDIVRTAQFNGPTRQYTYDQHVTRFNDAYNELALLGEPIQEHVKVQLVCHSLQEAMMSQPKMSIQLVKEMSLNFTNATGELKSMRAILVSDKAKAGEARYIAELGIEPQKRKGGGDGGGGHPRNKRKKKGGGASGARGGLHLHGYSDKEWHDLPTATKAKANAGLAAGKAAKRATAAASSAKSSDTDKQKEAEKGTVKFGKSAHACIDDRLAEAVELPEPAEPPDPATGPFAMMISSLSRTERMANLRRIFKRRRDRNQSELDSHVDMCVAGANTRVTDYTDTKVSVSPFSDSYEAIKDVPIATMATAWDDPATCDVTVLYIHEVLYFGDRMSHTLLWPNQLRANGREVQDMPKQFDAESPHAIVDPTGTL